ncbi:4-hydroxy-3-methylbut-2-enyl diphosphate reductase [Desulfosporosinus fructosivorans]|uniref:4-hydroxy-3-methylbut-2-enyl diphosphate reductase n=1 Tax=Desulfosporosinus fructosivorans TaxID=2018669 RepID=A0A4Z0R5A1_9FIRM|nr:4-hydroxy-3-methylbut-2-enyl diphosphate reductase [Desulfosporosinus fructosivorans]TGE37704.1 4-hydroxy-3-methylbut-2-enyl diphosphate reductase [Desulfosporosinus fructosivorans]
MKVKLAAKAGFCFGVKRALDMAERTVENSPSVSLGPLIHNQQVVKRLAERGIRVVNALEEVSTEQALIIRSHGVGPNVYQGAENKGIQVVDATCPFVQKAQRLAAESAQMGQQVIVMGDKLHPEVQGILGWAGEQAIPIQTLEEAKELSFYSQLAVLAQTTQLAESFEGIVEELKLHTNDLTVHNTICNATAERQKAARELAQTVDVMVVVGGRNSANTEKLASICAELTKTYLIETAEELEVKWFDEVKIAGLTAGASTPDWIIEEVYQKMTEIDENEISMDDWEKIAPVSKRVKEEEGPADLSRRHERNGGARLNGLVESKEEISAKVIEIVKGGLVVDVGMRGFVPASQIHLDYIEDLNQFLGKTLRLRMIEFDPDNRKAVFSQKVILEEERAVKRQERLETLTEGDIVTGVVRRLADFGAFVDIGGVDGLLHISDMAYTRIKHPSEMLKIGDEVELQVLKFDQQTGKISLGLKQLKVSPWLQVAEKYPVGTLVEGVVVRIVTFGAFVGLADGVDGLVHISQLTDHRINKVEEVLKVGDVVCAKVIECKPEEKRISLSMREMVEDVTRANDVEAMASQPEIKPVTIGDVLGKIKFTDK